MDTEFITARYPDQEMPRTQSRAEMRERVHAFVPPSNKARLREVGGQWGPWRSEAEAVFRIMDRTDRMGVGPKLIVQRERDREMLSIREVSVVPDLGAAPAVEEIHAVVWDEFNVRSGGLWLCRFVDGTDTVSRHGFLSKDWKGAAEDIFVLNGGMPALVKVAEFIVDRSKAGKLGAQTVIVDNDIWTRSGGWRVYSGVRHYHVHTDVPGGGPCNP